MLGEKGTLVVEATTGAAALEDGAFSVFSASAVLMESSGGDAVGSVNAKTFPVINTMPIPVRAGDEIIVTKTVQGFYVTVSHNLCRAKWIQYPYATSGSVVVEAFYDGRDPTECGEITVIYPLGEPCEGDTVIAFYDPNEDQYVAIATESAMLGPPVNVDIVTTVDSEPCGLEVSALPMRAFKQTCAEGPITPIVDSVALGETIPVVMSLGADECGKINYAFQNIKAFLCNNEGEPTEPEIADFPLNLGDAMFVTGGSFGGPPCDGTAEWSWDGTIWNQTSFCAAGCDAEPPAMPGTSPGQIATTSCVANAGTGCGLNLIFKTLDEICSTYPSPPPGVTTHIPLNLQPLIVTTDVTLETGEIAVDKAVIYVCDYGTADPSSIPLYVCVTPPPAPCSENVTVYTWDPFEANWVMTTPCPEGCINGDAPLEAPLDPEDPEQTTVSVPCIEPE